MEDKTFKTALLSMMCVTPIFCVSLYPVNEMFLQVVLLLSECQWKDKLIEMELWTKLASIALRQKEYKLVNYDCHI